MNRIYFVPSPDMDERAIDSIEVEGMEIVRLNLPEIYYESRLEDILEFLKSQIADPKPILLGFCYGGVLAIDVGRHDHNG